MAKKEKSKNKVVRLSKVREADFSGLECSERNQTGDAVWRWGSIIFVCLAVLGVYGQSVNFRFIWDDVQINICENPYLREFTLGNLVKFWTQEYGKLYIPLVYTVWMGLAQVSRWINPNYRDTDLYNQTNLMPEVFHAANLVVAVINGILVMVLLRRFVKCKELALLGALLFSLHPLSVEPVSWVTGMKDLLSAMLFFLTLYCGMRYREAQLGGRVRDVEADRWYWGGLGAFILGLMAKPSLVITPLVMMGLDYFFYRRKWDEVLRLYLGWVLIGVLWTAWIKTMQPMTEVRDQIPSWGNRIWIALDAFGFYVKKFFYPHPIIIDYGRTPQWLMAQEGWRTGAIVTGAALLGLALWKGFRRYFWIVGMAGVCVLPTLGLVPYEYQLRYSTVADRYFYLSLFWMVALVVIVVEHLAERLKKLKNRWGDVGRYGAIVALGVAVAICGIMSYGLCGRWLNGVTLYGSDVVKNPGSKHLNNNFASAVASKLPDRDFVLGEEFARRSVKIDPNFYEGLYTLGDILVYRGKMDEAIKYLRLAMENRPDLDLPVNRLLEVLMKEKRYTEAFQTIEEVFRRRGMPSQTDDVYWARISQAAAARGSWNAALEAMKRAANANPENFNWNIVAANLAIQVNQASDALFYAQRTLDLNRNDPAALLTYGKALALNKSPEKALVIFENILQLQPDNPEVLALIALAKNDLGDVEGAREAAQVARIAAFRTRRKDIIDHVQKLLEMINARVQK